MQYIGGTGTDDVRAGAARRGPQRDRACDRRGSHLGRIYRLSRAPRRHCDDADRAGAPEQDVGGGAPQTPRAQLSRDHEPAAGEAASLLTYKHRACTTDDENSLWLCLLRLMLR